ncbi:hypothetical protein GGI35DRAFT_155515 [Trichoderma velutinum]
MHSKLLISYALAVASATASPAAVIYDPPMITLYREPHLEGDSLKLWSIGDCVTIGGTMYNHVGSVNVRTMNIPSYFGLCTLYSSDGCKPGTEKRKGGGMSAMRASRAANQLPNS